MPESAEEPREAAPPPTLRPVRRAPKFGHFIAVGALIGAVIGVLLALRGGSGSYSEGAVAGLFALIFGGVGALVAAVLALILDRRTHS